MPDISVILATRDRADLLPSVLDGFRRQSLSRSDYEIVAIDDGSRDATRDILAAACRDLPIRVLHQRRAGTAAALNLGVFASVSPLILFVDDDCIPDPGLLAAHVEAHRQHPAETVTVRGAATPTPDIAASPTMHHVTELGCQLLSCSRLTPGATYDFTAFRHGQCSCKRAFLLAHGLFNPLLGFGCEDVELGWRLSHRPGFRVIYRPTARSVLVRKLNFRAVCAQQEQLGTSSWLLSQLHQSTAIRTFCAIDEGLQTWKAHAGRYPRIVNWVEGLDRMAEARIAAGSPLDPQSQDTLEEAYHLAFQLSRAKGIASNF
jgi:glycosyltransferase involved in cell wall biosynthesis